MNLAQTLQAFAQALDEPQCAASLFGPTAKGISAYANNRLFNRADALQEAFPVVCQLVGQDFFGAMARHYARFSPSHSPDLHDYGASFADFIADFPPAAELPYLSDCARLDWLCHRAYFAADPEPLDLTRLANYSPEQQSRLCFGLAPACGLLSSQWPIASLWRAHQSPPASAFPTLEQDGERVLVWRDDHNRVKVCQLSPAEYAFLEACAAQQTLANALEQAFEFDPDFDLALLLKRWVDDQMITRLC